MSYLAHRLLTLPLFVALAASSLAAQSDQVRRELDDLASPYAIDRAAAIYRIAGIQDDISSDLRVAYRFADLQERMGLLEAAKLRADAALVQQAGEALSEPDERMVWLARDYLLSLPFERVKVDEIELTEAQREQWQAFVAFRTRRDIARVLLEAHLAPGKYAGQFEELLQFGPDVLRAELLLMIGAGRDYADALNFASTEVSQADGPGARLYAANWRRLRQAAGAFEPAFDYLIGMKVTPDVERGIRTHTRAAYLAAHEVLAGVRLTAIRALYDGVTDADLASELQARYHALRAQAPDGSVANALGLDALIVELEVALARCGDDRLLAARIDGLRVNMERAQQARVNVNLRPGNRPDLMVQNEIAHLMLRAGNAEAAEQEWQAAAEHAIGLSRESDARGRASVASYLAGVYYNLACAQSLQARLTRSMVSLQRAVEYGYKDFGWMLEDGDLTNVRQSDVFRAWFENIAPPSLVDTLHRDGDQRDGAID